MTLRGNVSGSRAAALSLLALLIVAAWIGPVSAYLGVIDVGADQLIERQAFLQRYRALVDAPTEPSVQAPLTTGRDSLLPEVAEAKALALLQETVKGIAVASRIQVHSLQVLRSEPLGDAVKIGVRIRAAGDVAGLGHLIYAIESARPILYPDKLQIQSPATASGASSGNLDFQLDVFGFRAGAAL